MKKLVILILLLLVAINGFSIVKNYKFNIERVFYNTEYNAYVWYGYIINEKGQKADVMIYNMPEDRNERADRWIRNRTYKIVVKIDYKNRKSYALITYSPKKVDLEVEELLLDENGI